MRADDLFYVLDGRLTIELRDRHVHLGPGELFVVPKGVEHRPVAAEEVQVLLIEASGTPNTGDEAPAAAKERLAYLGQAFRSCRRRIERFPISG